MNRVRTMIVFLLCCLLLAGCAANGQSDWRNTDVEIDLDASSQFSEQDLESAVDAVMQGFSSFGEGFTMQRIVFDHDGTAEELDWINQHTGVPNAGSFTECVCFLSAFHTPPMDQMAEAAWNADSDYIGWNWWLARTDGGDWVVVDMGY